MGLLFSLLTSVCWALTSIFFTAGGKQVGSRVVNRVRLLFGFLLLGVTNLVLYREFIPLSAAPDRWLWLGLSGLVGLVLGDVFLFQSFLWIGPRRAMLIMAGVPVLNTIFAWFLLGEQLAPLRLLGIVVTVSGILLVLSEKTGNGDQLLNDRKHFSLGIAFCILGALGQSAGMLLGKRGVYGDFPALSGTLMRVTAAVAAMWLVAALGKQVRPSIEAVTRDRKALGFILLGTLAGPFLGIWLSLAGLQNTEVGIASTLQALAPVIMLPVSHFLYDEKVTLRAVIGTLVSMAGVAMLFLLG